MKKITSLVSVQLTAAVLVQAFCPTPTVNYAWSTGIGYAWPGSNPPPAWTALSVDAMGIADDINGAFNQWTCADQNQNSTNDTFYQGTGGIRVYVYQVNFPGVPGGGDPFQAANYAASTYEGTSIVASQDITLYIGSTCGGQNPYPCWDINAGNFHAFVQKTMAHEIGHCMGLNDQIGDACLGQTPGESVMNGQCGTNDAQGALPAPMLGLPNCDNMSIW